MPENSWIRKLPDLHYLTAWHSAFDRFLNDNLKHHRLKKINNAVGWVGPKYF